MIKYVIIFCHRKNSDVHSISEQTVYSIIFVLQANFCIVKFAGGVYEFVLDFVLWYEFSYAFCSCFSDYIMMGD